MQPSCRLPFSTKSSVLLSSFYISNSLLINFFAPMETIPLFISEQIEEGSCEIACLAPRVVYTESAEVSPDIAYLPPKLSRFIADILF